MRTSLVVLLAGLWLGGSPDPIIAAVCGDGILEGSEECDAGTENGIGGCCATACYQLDADGDTVCDALDPCPSPAAIAVHDARLRIGRIGGSPADDTLLFRGSIAIPEHVSIDPSTSGVRLVVSQVFYIGLLLDVVIPGGSGWSGNGAGTWRYRDGSGRFGGITNVVVRRAPSLGTVTISLRGRHGTYALARETFPAKLAVSFAPGESGATECAESWIARFLCALGAAGRTLLCTPPPPIRSCAGDPDDLVKCDLRNLASAQEAQFVVSGYYLAGVCDDVPGFVGSPNVVCVTTSKTAGFSAAAAHPSATDSCEWDSDPPPGTPSMVCTPLGAP